MKKINWKVFLEDIALWPILGLLLTMCELYRLTSDWEWLVNIVVWCIGLFLHLHYLSGLAVGGATKEKLDE